MIPNFFLSRLISSQIWLNLSNLLRDDCHFFLPHLLMDDGWTCEKLPTENGNNIDLLTQTWKEYKTVLSTVVILQWRMLKSKLSSSVVMVLSSCPGDLRCAKTLIQALEPTAFTSTFAISDLLFVSAAAPAARTSPWSDSEAAAAASGNNFMSVDDKSWNAAVAAAEDDAAAAAAAPGCNVSASRPPKLGFMIMPEGLMIMGTGLDLVELCITLLLSWLLV